MVVLYTIPSSKYRVTPAANSSLDEIEVLGPPPVVSQNAQNSAEFQVNVKSAQLTNAKATIIVTRFQSGLTDPTADWAAPVPAPTNINWAFDTPTQIESRWSTTSDVPQNFAPRFSVTFQVGAPGPTYRLTYRLEADEFNEPVETMFDMTVS